MMAKWIKFKGVDGDGVYFVDLHKVDSLNDSGGVLGLYVGGEVVCVEEGFAAQSIIRYFEQKSIPIEKLGETPNV